MKKVYFGCEDIIFAERNDTYKSLIDFCIEHSPKMPRAEFLLVTADGFVTQECGNNIFVLPNAHLW